MFTSCLLGVRSNVISISVCLSVCVSVCLSTYIPQNHMSSFTKFSVYVTRDHDSVLLWQQCNMLSTSGFVDDITFSHNGKSVPETKMMHIFCPVYQVGRQTLFDRVRQVVALGVKYAVFDCIFLWIGNIHCDVFVCIIITWTFSYDLQYDCNYIMTYWRT